MMLMNNLKNMIKASDRTLRDVAAQKGITPESISRQCNGKTPLNEYDAQDYAEILGCNPWDIMYQNPPVPLLAAIMPWDEITDDYFVKNAPDSKIPTSDNGGKPELFIAHEWSTERSKRFENKSVFLHDYYKDEVMAVYWDHTIDLPENNTYTASAIEIVDAEPLRTKTISRDGFGYYSYAMTEGGELLYGILYQAGKNNFTIESVNFGTHTNLKLLWAAPSLALITRPDLRGVKIVDRPTPKLNEVIGTKAQVGGVKLE
jgi:transcriptional regulator with XRE-family HTH domain